MSVRCGYCGEELDRLGSDHTCARGVRVGAAMAGNVDPILKGEDA